LETKEATKVRKGLFGILGRLFRQNRRVVREAYPYLEKLLSKPQRIEIETISYCNAQCSMCPIPSMKRKKGIMTDDLYKKIIDELAEVQPLEICPFNDGEPLLDKKLVSRIRYINDVLPKAKVIIYTNAALLTREKIEELNTVKVDRLNISFNAARKSTYERVMKGLQYDQVINNIEDLLKFGKIREKVISFTKLDENKGEAPLFRKMWEGKGLEVLVWPRMDFGGKIGLSLTQRLRRFLDFLLPPKPCTRALTTMTILYDGRASICCRDYEGEVILGDVSKSSLLSVWNSELARELRLKQLEGRRKEIRMCKICPGYDDRIKKRRIEL